MKDPVFLSIDQVLELHKHQIERYGGSEGVRDLGLLESAVAAPQASFGGTWLHDSIEEMAAAYLYHLAQNHPFVDGNKRIAAVSMIVFLRLNDLTPTFSADELVELTLSVAAGKTSKPEVGVFLAAHVKRTR